MSTPGSYGIITAPVYVATVALVFAPCVATVPIYVQMTGIAVLVIFLGGYLREREDCREKLLLVGSDGPASFLHLPLIAAVRIYSGIGQGNCSKVWRHQQ